MTAAPVPELNEKEKPPPLLVVTVRTVPSGNVSVRVSCVVLLEKMGADDANPGLAVETVDTDPV